MGVRELDEPERRHLREWGVATFTMRTIDERGLRSVMQEALAIAGNGTGGIHVSMDLDWLDPVHAPGVGTPARHTAKAISRWRRLPTVVA